ncbi:hypothetical protein ABT115_15140 [Streptomyces sp. NPDC001832]|uniref:hypothetical protein n=1 Tax=Streptomyces sp. NPDC001832 TaxID=3154527 RepID=UPI0033339D1E
MSTNYTPCPSGKHRVHPNQSCEEVGDRAWDPIIGYRTEAEAAPNPPQFTGILGSSAKES